MKKFWNWTKDEESGVRTLYLDGTIAEESWFDDDVTPKAFKADLFAGDGDIVHNLPCGSDYEDISQALVEDDLWWDPGVRATHNDGKGMLSGEQLAHAVL